MTRKRLSLSKETIRNLTTTDLAGVRGGTDTDPITRVPWTQNTCNCFTILTVTKAVNPVYK